MAATCSFSSRRRSGAAAAVAVVASSAVAAYFAIASIGFEGFGWKDWGGLYVNVYTAVIGIVLGVAPAFHNGLFALQLPVLALQQRHIPNDFLQLDLQVRNAFLDSFPIGGRQFLVLIRFQ